MEKPSPSANSTPKPRIDALDQTKGVLVVLMVVYHTLNYTSEYYLAFRYLSFLPPSFILISGYLLSVVYLARYNGTDHEVQKRILVRGVKLFLLFTALNILTYLFFRRAGGGEHTNILGYFDHWREIYVTGSGRLAVFEVLLPISYLLILAPLLIWAAYRQRAALLAITVILLTACTVLEWEGYSTGNLNLLSVGVFGMLIGHTVADKINGLGGYLLFSIIAYCGYLLVGAWIGQTYLVQLLGATLALALIFSLCARLGLSGMPRNLLVKLGQYSLIAYIAQIGLLQILSRVVHRPAPVSPGASFLFAATLILTYISVALIDWLRPRFWGVEKCYKAIFG